MGVMRTKRENPEFQDLLRECITVDPKTGNLKVKGCYVQTYVNIKFKGEIVSVSHASLVWFLTHGRWPKPGFQLDHVNDDPMDNRPDNLQEITEAENHAKRRGRAVYKSYGKGKYGYGLSVHYDKRDERYYVSRNISRGFGEGDLRGIKIPLGGFDSEAEALAEVNRQIDLIKEHGLGYIPEPAQAKPKKASLKLDALEPKMFELRRQGMTFQQIADELGISMGSVYKRLMRG